MYHDFYSALTSSPLLPLAAMAFFLGSFVVVLLRVLVVQRRHDFDVIAALPLDDTATSAPESSARSESSEVRP